VTGLSLPVDAVGAAAASPALMGRRWLVCVGGGDVLMAREEFKRFENSAAVASPAACLEV